MDEGRLGLALKKLSTKRVRNIPEIVMYTLVDLSSHILSRCIVAYSLENHSKIDLYVLDYQRIQRGLLAELPRHLLIKSLAVVLNGLLLLEELRRLDISPAESLLGLIRACIIVCSHRFLKTLLALLIA